MAGKMRPEFYRLHAATLALGTTADELTSRLRAADAVPDRHRLSEGAVYAAAQRRYRMLTGRDWKASQQGPADTRWGGQSDHRPRVAGDGWACSCGQVGTGGTAGHGAHREEAAHAGA